MMWPGLRNSYFSWMSLEFYVKIGSRLNQAVKISILTQPTETEKQTILKTFTKMISAYAYVKYFHANANTQRTRSQNL